MSNSRSRPTSATGTINPGSGFEVIDPAWLLRAVGSTLLAALVCGYLTLCLLFYQGQWQLILHPTLGQGSLSSVAGLPAQSIRFDAAETGTPRLSGALIPAPRGGRYTTDTVLYLRGGNSSLAADPADARNLTILHNLGLNIFAFDYRGYGQSDPTHPNQVRMTEDAAAALRYLTETRSIPQSRLILYGTGVGASLATSLAATHPQITALILDDPGPPPIDRALADPRTRLLPVRALFNEDFSLDSLTNLTIAKLLISYPTAAVPIPVPFSTAPDPKMTIELQSADMANQSAAIARFLDQTLTPTIQEVKE